MNLQPNVKSLIWNEQIWYSLKSDFIDNSFIFNTEILQKIKSKKIISVNLVEYLLEMLWICIENNLNENLSEVSSLIEQQISKMKFLPCDLIDDAINFATKFLFSSEFITIIDVICRINKDYKNDSVIEYLSKIISSEDEYLEEKCLEILQHINARYDKLPNNLILTLIKNMNLKNQHHILQILKYKIPTDITDPKIDQALIEKLKMNGLEITLLEYINSNTINGITLQNELLEKITKLIKTRFDLVDHIFEIFYSLHKTTTKVSTMCQPYIELASLIDQFDDLSNQSDERFCDDHTKLLKEIEEIISDFDLVPIKLVQTLIDTSYELLLINQNKFEPLALKWLNLYKELVVKASKYKGEIY